MTSISYRSVLMFMVDGVKRHRAAQVTFLIGSSTFAVFTMFWTGLTFTLSSRYGERAIYRTVVA
ncbi:hypothetical protein ABK249_29485 [Neorhizobium sp. Rsf11]|uniref:ABC transporter permease n=2 Tax=Neorhizobium TaxID=1525371 RepID=A0ABV0MAW7_9HYPH|nr:hypothetical protein [Neorhizobium petrolearium]MCC2613809.1 hypothetical protein [Neorhizobium petrolearium]WGI72118.1 hypothetical protein QEO92_28690 [Neorhizobium petrolearium]